MNETPHLHSINLRLSKLEGGGGEKRANRRLGLGDKI